MTDRTLLLTIAAIGLMVLAGCAGKTQWYKPGATQQEFALTSYQCENDMRTAANQYGVDPLVGMLAMGQDQYNRCMTAHGWYPQ